jgi:single-stranded DNA-specific DHH superfamily exonuclease
MNKKITVVLLLVLAAGCNTNPKPQDGFYPMDPTRKVSVQVCTRQIDTTDGGNLLCRDETEADRRARIEEEERQARARKEAEERAARERLERERAEQLAREEAARMALAAEAARLAAERQRLEAEAAAAAALKAQEEERLAAEARARQLAEQEAREAAERECRRLEQERSDGRAMLADFVDKYGKVDEFKGIAGQISAFLAKTPKAKPCPPASSTPRLSQTDNQLAKPR